MKSHCWHIAGVAVHLGEETRINTSNTSDYKILKTHSMTFQIINDHNNFRPVYLCVKGGPKAPKQRCIRIQSPDEDLEKLLKNRPKVSLTPAEIEEDMKFFSQIMQGATTSSDTLQKKVLFVSEAA
uniref:Uncharacterized protein n=1 Tax=Tanacetum cinerariifolium TaxID=118510 RepID=A0A699IKN7_TANCI|nr:hypothetical protein [Tanacetum cinerariifolium]